MTTGIASPNPQTLIVKAKFNRRTTPTENLTAPAKTLEELWQQVNDFLDLNKYTEAIAVLDSIIKLKPDSFVAWHWRGNSFANLGRYQEAIASYDEAIKIKPNYFLAWFEKRVLLLFLLISRFVLV
jgi:tetratricopeptide (TPR) repeat protein